MPTSALRPCSRCGALRCVIHRRKPWSHATPSRHCRGYGAAWDRVRRQVLEEEPFCALREGTICTLEYRGRMSHG